MSESAALSLGGEHELLIDLLLREALLDEGALPAVRELQQKEECRLETALYATRTVTDLDIARTYAKYLHVPLVELDATELDLEEGLHELFPENFLRQHTVFPLRRTGDNLHVAMVDPSDLSIAHEIQLYTELTPIVHVAPIGQIESALNALFGARDLVREISLETGSEDAEQADVGEEIIDLDKPIVAGDDTQIIRIVNHIIREAIADGTSDIHIEPQAETVSVRYRIDGSLQARPSPPKSMYLPLISRLKIISRMDIAEKRLPQDGAFSVIYNGSQIDMRVSTVPIIFGEKMVIRILNKDALPLDLKKLGFDDNQCAAFHAGAEQPHGLIFVTGPTGSGKSTTLYATLKLLNSPDRNIVTVEDPVEYKMQGVNQVQTHSAIGLTFAGALRSFLRQDPDVIMVGEVRDQETAEICMRAALTGHLVLSTLHTNSALAAVDRLVDMGIEPFMVASTLQLVEAQRLVRRLCTECKVEDPQAEETLIKYGLDPMKTLYRAGGCNRCNGTGYKGRVGIFEVIRVTPKLRALIQGGAPLDELQKMATREGMASLAAKGFDAVQAGLTSLEEIVSTVVADNE
jgi:type IV pilus assembly protein PilB